MTETPKPLRERVPKLPAGMATAVARAMARDKDARFGDLSQLIAALEPHYRARAPIAEPQPAAASGEASEREPDPPTPLASESIPSPSPLRFGSHRTQLWLAGTFGALLLIAFVAAIFSRPDTPAMRTTTSTNAIHQATPKPETEPEPPPIELHIEDRTGDEPTLGAPVPAPVPEAQPQVEAHPEAQPAEPEAPAQPEAEPTVVEPRRPSARRAPKPAGTSQPNQVRPRVELRADDFDQ